MNILTGINIYCFHLQIWPPAANGNYFVKPEANVAVTLAGDK